MPVIQIARGLADQLNSVQDKNAMLEDLLFEIPDEALQQFAELADPTSLEVSDTVRTLINQMSEAFGMTPLGLTVLMSQIFERTVKVQTRFDGFKRAWSE